MLNIITGRTGSGKTRYIREKAAEIAGHTQGSAIIIVPEQFSFETERAMLDILGNEKFNNVEILSFSRIAEKLLTQYGKIDRKTADDATRAVLMSMSVESLEDQLTIYPRYRKNPLLIGEMLNFYREIKKCCIPVTELEKMSHTVKKPSFARKLNELSLIFSCYETMLGKSFYDDCDYLDMLCELLYEAPYFNGKTVFVDAFSGFSAQEYKILERIMATAKDVFVTFCCDTKRNNQRYELFANAADEIRRLKNCANRVGVKIAPEKILYADRKYKAESLNILEENIFTANSETFCDTDGAVSLISCKTKTDECDFVASEIKRLVRKNNYRYRDIAVIERNNGTYKNEIFSSFRKYGIDYFPDNRQPIVNQPLMAFVLSLFDLLVEGFRTETVLRFLKTGLYSFTVEEISQIEDYTLSWQIDGKEWKSEWVNNPDGLGVEFNDFSREKLAALNKLRERIAGPVLALKNRICDADGGKISYELFNFLRISGTDENLKSLAEKLKENGETDLSAEQGRIWKILTEIFDSLHSVTKGISVSLQRYRELFEIIVSTKDLGEIPNGADEVIVGSADRIRAASPKAVFIVGANTGVFPTESSGGVLLTDNERCELQRNGAQIVSNLEYNSVSERFIAYHAMTLATEKLYVSFSNISSGSESLSPSELITEIKRIFPEKEVRTQSNLEKIESRKSAFTAMAEEKGDSTVLGATLRDFFENEDSRYELSMLEKINKNTFEIKDKKLAAELFGKSMYISASKTEKYYKCPFRYFCEYGFKAQPRKTAEMDPARTGTLIHYALEKFISENSKEQIEKFTREQIKEKTDIIIDGYVNDKLSGYDGKNNWFLRAIQLIKENTYIIVMQIADEFANSKFTPVDFELSINNDGEISPYLIELENGGTVKIIGSVDRVDVYENGNNSFVRVIDYKTGGKIFNLDEVFAGLNMQMLIYLFAIWQNGGEKYKNVIPAGILYFQAKNDRITRSKSDRYMDDETLKSTVRSNFKMNGMVLNNAEVITAMERDGAGVFIPAKLDKNGNATGRVISVKALQKLKDKVNGLICKMAYSLQDGNIDAFPVDGGCDYCDYHDVCRRCDDDPIREIEKMKFEDAIETLAGECDGD